MGVDPPPLGWGVSTTPRPSRTALSPHVWLPQFSFQRGVCSSCIFFCLRFILSLPLSRCLGTPTGAGPAAAGAEAEERRPRDVGRPDGGEAAAAAGGAGVRGWGHPGNVSDRRAAPRRAQRFPSQPLGGLLSWARKTPFEGSASSGVTTVAGGAQERSVGAPPNTPPFRPGPAMGRCARGLLWGLGVVGHRRRSCGRGASPRNGSRGRRRPIASARPRPGSRSPPPDPRPHPHPEPLGGGGGKGPSVPPPRGPLSPGTHFSPRGRKGLPPLPPSAAPEGQPRQRGPQPTAGPVGVPTGGLRLRPRS